MHATAIRRLTLIPSGLLALAGLTFAPAVTPSAAAGTVVTICNSGDSPHNQFGDFHVVRGGYNFLVHAGKCVTVGNTTDLRVKKFGSPIWRVRSVPGTYGIRAGGKPESNPGNKDKYSYLLAPSGC